jgi:TRAP-type C4-dicarboxylate transport system substrate-binding protein
MAWTPSLPGHSYADAWRLYQAARPAQEKLLASQGMKLLFSVPWPGQSLYSNKPIQTPADFGHQDARLQPDLHAHCAAAQGPAGDHPAVRAGAGLATNTVNNFLTSSASGVESKLYEQIKYFYTVNAWLPRNATVVNQKAFDSLDKPTAGCRAEGRRRGREARLGIQRAPGQGIPEGAGRQGHDRLPSRPTR